MSNSKPSNHGVPRNNDFSSTSKGFRLQNSKSKGFKIGKKKFSSPSSDAYLGKARKIKETLIHKAKLKRQRAKELKKAGYDLNQEETKNELHPDKGGSEDNEFQTEKSARVSSKNKTEPSKPKSKDFSAKSNKNSKKENSQSQSHLDDDSNRSTLNNTSFNPPKNICQNNHNDGISKSEKSKKPKHYHHSNGQPRLSQKVNKILDKLQNN